MTIAATLVEGWPRVRGGAAVVSTIHGIASWTVLVCSLMPLYAAARIDPNAIVRDDAEQMAR